MNSSVQVDCFQISAAASFVIYSQPKMAPLEEDNA